MRTELQLTRWQDEFWLASISRPFNGRGGLRAGNRPEAASRGFKPHRFGPYTRPEDMSKPHEERRHDHYVTEWFGPLTRRIMRESTLYDVFWRGIPLRIQQWVDPPPHGDRLTVGIDPYQWAGFAQRDKMIQGMRDLAGISPELLNAPESAWWALVPQLEADGWWVHDWRNGLYAQTEKYIRELELVPKPWPQEMMEGLPEDDAP